MKSLPETMKFWSKILLAVILATDVNTACEPGWIGFTDSCYLINPQTLQWQDARKFCQSLNSHLTIVMSHEENNFLKAALRNLNADPLGQFWLDGNDLNAEDEWVWETTGEPFEVTDWYPGEPNQSLGEEDCLTYFVRYDMKWNDEHCDRYLWSICEKEGMNAAVG